MWSLQYLGSDGAMEKILRDMDRQKEGRPFEFPKLKWSVKEVEIS